MHIANLKAQNNRIFVAQCGIIDMHHMLVFVLIHEQFERYNYVVALHWLPQWHQFEARLYHKTGNGMIELGKF